MSLGSFEDRLGYAARISETITEYAYKPWHTIKNPRHAEMYGKVYSAVTSVFTTAVYQIPIKNVIFLDIDETLRSRTRESEKAEEEAYCRDPINYFLNENGPLNEQAVAHLEYVLEEVVPDAVIIMTSDWSKGRTVVTLREHTLKKYNFAKRIYDKIPESIQGHIAYYFCERVAPEYILERDRKRGEIVSDREEDAIAAGILKGKALTQWREEKEQEFYDHYRSLGLQDEERFFVLWKQLRDQFIRRSVKIIDVLADLPQGVEFVIIDDAYVEGYKTLAFFNQQYDKEPGVFQGRFIKINPRTLLNASDVKKIIDIFNSNRIGVV